MAPHLYHSNPTHWQSQPSSAPRPTGPTSGMIPGVNRSPAASLTFGRHRGMARPSNIYAEPIQGRETLGLRPGLPGPRNDYVDRFQSQPTMLSHPRGHPSTWPPHPIGMPGQPQNWQKKWHNGRHHEPRGPRKRVQVVEPPKKRKAEEMATGSYVTNF